MLTVEEDLKFLLSKLDKINSVIIKAVLVAIKREIIKKRNIFNIISLYKIFAKFKLRRKRYILETS